MVCKECMMWIRVDPQQELRWLRVDPQKEYGKCPYLLPHEHTTGDDPCRALERIYRDGEEQLRKKEEERKNKEEERRRYKEERTHKRIEFLKSLPSVYNCGTCGWYNNDTGLCDYHGKYIIPEFDVCEYYTTKTEGCFIVTACLKARKLPDDCEQLRILRKFRDEFVSKTVNGKQDIEKYYRVAPLIVDAIETRKDRLNIYNGIYTDIVEPCIDMIRKRQYQKAYQLYKNNTINLAKMYLDKDDYQFLIIE